MPMTQLRRPLLLLGIGTFALAQPYRPIVFVGESMAPTYGDREVALSVPVRGNLKIGDVVLVKTEAGKMVKRIAYLPGDRVPQLRTKRGWYDIIDVDVRPLVEKRPWKIQFQTVPHDHVYVLGDNRTASFDSRHFGFVPIQDVKRRVIPARVFVEKNWANPTGEFMPQKQNRSSSAAVNTRTDQER